VADTPIPNTATRFLLNDRLVATDAADGRLALDWLRRERRLVGTKEGCKEGDCGACVVLVGESDGQGGVAYLPVTSCLLPIGALHGKHLVTIEGLDLGPGPGQPCAEPGLNPVQRAIVDEGGSQCGFCTPGIVLSLTCLLTRERQPLDGAAVDLALSGHLCRCTGYRSLKAAGGTVRARAGTPGIDAQVAAGHLPAYFADAAGRLAAIPAREASSTADSTEVPIAGGTDLYVQREDLPRRPVRVLAANARAGGPWRGIERHDGGLRLGALTTFQDLAETTELRGLLPRLPEAMDEIASWQIRNRATIGGNLVNASPIGDLTAILLALDAQLLWVGPAGQREQGLRALYRGYKQLAKAPDEVLREVRLATPAGRVCHFEKVAKRRCLDIATVNSALAVDLDANGTIREAGLALGGVAPVPLYAAASSALLRGRRPDAATWAELIEVAQSEVAPISDVRGSADYKRLLVRQLLIAHGIELFPDDVRVEAFYPELAHG
jgi:xanthine dehydrogenase small subunit